jgi:hypothetical protein
MTLKHEKTKQTLHLLWQVLLQLHPWSPFLCASITLKVNENELETSQNEIKGATNVILH